MTNRGFDLQRQSSHGLWDVTAGAAPATAALRSRVRCDVVVVGAGYTGVSTALHLAERGIHVVLLEASSVGAGAAGRSSGLVNSGMWVLPDDLPKVLGPEFGERLLRVLGEAPGEVARIIQKYGIECEFEQNGTLQCAVGKDGLRQIETRADQWARRGANIELLDASETARRVGTDRYAGALLDRRTGTVQPLAYVRGLASAAQQAGAEIYTSTPVVGMQREGTGWSLDTPSGQVFAHKVVSTTDAYTEKLWPEVASELTLLPYFNMATPPLSPDVLKKILPARQAYTDTRTVLSSVRLDQAGRLIVGSIGALRATGSPIHQFWASKYLQKLFPQLGAVELEHQWYGNIGMTSTHLPVMHMLDRGVISVGGYNGRGIAAGTVMGRFLAEYLTGVTTAENMPLPMTEAVSARFRDVGSLYYEYGAQAAHLLDAVIP